MKIQLEFDFDRKFESLEEATIDAFYKANKPQKYLAAELGYSPAGLSKRLNQNPAENDPRLNLKDLEKFIEVTGDYSPIYYLVNKFLNVQRESELEAFRELKKRLPEIERLLRVIKEEKK